MNSPCGYYHFPVPYPPMWLIPVSPLARNIPRALVWTRPCARVLLESVNAWPLLVRMLNLRVLMVPWWWRGWCRTCDCRSSRGVSHGPRSIYWRLSANGRAARHGIEAKAL